MKKNILIILILAICGTFQLKALVKKGNYTINVESKTIKKENSSMVIDWSIGAVNTGERLVLTFVDPDNIIIFGKSVNAGSVVNKSITSSWSGSIELVLKGGVGTFKIKAKTLKRDGYTVSSSETVISEVTVVPEQINYNITGPSKIVLSNPAARLVLQINNPNYKNYIESVQWSNLSSGVLQITSSNSDGASLKAIDVGSGNIKAIIKHKYNIPTQEVQFGISVESEKIVEGNDLEFYYCYLNYGSRAYLYPGEEFVVGNLVYTGRTGADIRQYEYKFVITDLSYNVKYDVTGTLDFQPKEIYTPCKVPKNAIPQIYKVRGLYRAKGSTTWKLIPHYFGENANFAIKVLSPDEEKPPLQSRSTSITDLTDQNKEEIQVYPNPVSDVVNLKSKNGNIEEYAIYNSAGVMVRRGNLNEQQKAISIGDLSAGIYILKIKVNNKVFSTKLNKL